MGGGGSPKDHRESHLQGGWHAKKYNQTEVVNKGNNYSQDQLSMSGQGLISLYPSIDLIIALTRRYVFSKVV